MTAKEFQTTILPAYGAMAATARRILGDEEIAKDAVQDVMRTLWETGNALMSRPTGEPTPCALCATDASTSAVAAPPR